MPLSIWYLGLINGHFVILKVALLDELSKKWQIGHISQTFKKSRIVILVAHPNAIITWYLDTHEIALKISLKHGEKVSKKAHKRPLSKIDMSLGDKWYYVKILLVGKRVLWPPLRLFPCLYEADTKFCYTLHSNIEMHLYVLWPLTLSVPGYEMAT